MSSLAGGVVHDASALLLNLPNASISLNKNQKKKQVVLTFQGGQFVHLAAD